MRLNMRELGDTYGVPVPAAEKFEGLGFIRGKVWFNVGNIDYDEGTTQNDADLSLRAAGVGDIRFTDLFGTGANPKCQGIVWGATLHLIDDALSLSTTPEGFTNQRHGLWLKHVRGKTTDQYPLHECSGVPPGEQHSQTELASAAAAVYYKHYEAQWMALPRVQKVDFERASIFTVRYLANSYLTADCAVRIGLDGIFADPDTWEDFDGWTGECLCARGKDGVPGLNVVETRRRLIQQLYDFARR